MYCGSISNSSLAYSSFIVFLTPRFIMFNSAASKYSNLLLKISKFGWRSIIRYIWKINIRSPQPSIAEHVRIAVWINKSLR